METSVPELLSALFAVGAIAVVLAIVSYPVWHILARLGYTPGSRFLWVVGFVLVPYLALWALAFSDWPRLRGLDSV